jgi:hypothetical protein
VFTPAVAAAYVLFSTIFPLLYGHLSLLLAS